MNTPEQIAAAHRIMAILNLNEGVDGHISVRDPADSETILLTPYPIHWSVVRAEDIAVVSLKDGQVLSNNYDLDEPAWFVHEPLHRLCRRHNCFIHAHPPEATTIACSNNGRVLPIHQHMIFLQNEIAYLDTYQGEVLSKAYGEVIAAALGSHAILFLSNHGVITAGATVAKALKRLYYLERACMFQNKLFASGYPSKVIESVHFLPQGPSPEPVSEDHAERLFRAWASICPQHEAQSRS